MGSARCELNVLGQLKLYPLTCSSTDYDVPLSSACIWLKHNKAKAMMHSKPKTLGLSPYASLGA